MLALRNNGYRLCDGLTRRELLRVGGLGLLGLSLPTLLNARRIEAGTGAASNFGRARSCILFYLSGGPPQHETWDPKPDAPAEIRGDFRPIASSVPGLHVGELMPRVAGLAHHCCVLRAVSTADNAHSSSGYWMLTGHPYLRSNTECNQPTPGDWPCLGSVVKRLRPGNGMLPPAVTLPEQMISNANIVAVGQHAGWLGRSADPWLLTCDPSAPMFQVPALGLPAEVPPVRLDERRSLLDQVTATSTLWTGPGRSIATTITASKHSTCCAPRAPAKHSTWTRSPRRCATAMAGTKLARACCWRAASWKPACRWCRSTGRAKPAI